MRNVASTSKGFFFYFYTFFFTINLYNIKTRMTKTIKAKFIKSYKLTINNKICELVANAIKNRKFV